MGVAYRGPSMVCILVSGRGLPWSAVGSMLGVLDFSLSFPYIPLLALVYPASRYSVFVLAFVGTHGPTEIV